VWGIMEGKLRCGLCVRWRIYEGKCFKGKVGGRRGS